MEITKYDKKDVKILTKRSQSDVNQVLKTVTDIINNVKINKDKSVKEYTEKFDGVFVEDLKVTENEIKQAYENLDENLINSLKSAT